MVRYFIQIFAERRNFTLSLNRGMQVKGSISLVFLWLSFTGFSQSAGVTPDAQISVITCGPGQELYASFGHSAFRVQDPDLGIDWVYNYGTFDFEAPNFYLNFARGRLLYSLTGSKFSDFLYTYQLENRWVREQILHLGLVEKNELFRFLENNRKPDNRDYKYDYLYDNCSTKIPDVLKDVLGEQLTFKQDHIEEGATFRALIQQNLRTNSWSSFGIDLALGAVIDKKASVLEHMFLPIYVLEQLNNATLGNRPLVERERTILENRVNKPGHYFTASPLFWLLLLLIFTAIITYIDFKNSVRSRWLDFFLFLLTGVIGLIIFFLWFLTDHSATAANLNILWAFPFNILASWFVVRKTTQLPPWFSRYVRALTGLLLLVALLWLLGVQRFSPLLILLLSTLSIRYVFLYRHIGKIQQTAP